MKSTSSRMLKCGNLFLVAVKTGGATSSLPVIRTGVRQKGMQEMRKIAQKLVSGFGKLHCHLLSWGILVVFFPTLMVVADDSPSAANIHKSVFDDVGLWIKGAYDRDDDVGMDYNDLRHAFSASSKFSNLLQWGAATNCVRRYEHVTCPYAGTVMSNVPCIYMPRNIDAEGKIHPRHFQISGGINVTNCNSTLVIRVRPDDPLADSNWLCGGIGYMVGFARDTDNEGYLKLRGYCGGWTNPDGFKVKTGDWIDLAVRPADSGIEFFAVTNGGVLWSTLIKTSVPQNTTNTTFYVGFYQSGYSSWSPVDLTGSSVRKGAFVGSIQSIALWNRSLSNDEIREAFASPRTDICRIGLMNGSGGEFIKSEPDGKTVNPDDWYSMPKELPAGKSMDIEFTLREHEYSLPQILRIAGVAGTDSGVELSVKVNGIDAPKSIPVEATAVNSLFLPGKFFRSGKNTLALTNASSGKVCFDALSLGGSWQLGFEDGSRSEFGDRVLGYAEEGNYKRIGGIARASSVTTVSANIPFELASSVYPMKFKVKVFTPYAYILSRYPNPMSYQLIVNGKEKLSSTLDKHPSDGIRVETLSVEFEPGELNPGTNTFAITADSPGAGGNQNYLCIDYWCLEVCDRPKGTVIIVR